MRFGRLYHIVFVICFVPFMAAQATNITANTPTNVATSSVVPHSSKDDGIANISSGIQNIPSDNVFNTASQATPNTHNTTQENSTATQNTRISLTSTLQDSHTQNTYLRGDTSLLSPDAPRITQQLSSTIEKAVGVQVFLYIIDRTPQSKSDTSMDYNQDSPQTRFDNRRAYEMSQTAQIEGKYAAIFLFYNDHAITLSSNLDFLDEQTRWQLLEDYAYPYLPADSVGSVRYSDGVNEGVSNLYLALMHTIATHYNITLDAPKPMEKQSEATKVIIYAMLLIMIGLFVIIRFGLGLKKKG